MYNPNKTCPKLSFDPGFECFTLRYDTTDEINCYEMLIHSYWNISRRYNYHFVKWNTYTGDYIEVVTSEQYQERIMDIRAYDGERAADIWTQKQNQVTVVRDSHPVFALAEYWEAIIALRLISLPASQVSWRGKELDPKIREEMDQARTSDERAAFTDEELEETLGAAASNSTA